MDDTFRVAQFEPEEEGREPTLFVFQRMSAEEEEGEPQVRLSAAFPVSPLGQDNNSM